MKQKSHKTSAFSLQPSAFSLIELLVAMAVTIVIVFMVTNMFRNASEAWDTGTQRAQMNTAARAAVDLIARELAGAMAGSIPGSDGSMITVRPFTLTNNDLRFTALSKDDGALRGVMFKFDGNSVEAYHNNDTPYGGSAWNWASAKLLITNVWRFEVNVYSNENDLTAGNYKDTYSSSLADNRLPVCVDIALEMLSDRDMRRAQSLGGDAGFVMTNSRVYTARVWLGNRGSK